MNILKFLKRHLKQLAVVAVLLVVQAVAELSLPQYMSDIVDIGVGQEGIRSTVFTQVRSTTLAELEAYLSQDENQYIEHNYGTPNASGIRTFTGKPEHLSANSELDELISKAIAKDLDVLGEEHATSLSIQFVRDEYATIGLDLEAIRTSYLLNMSGAMIARCLLALLAAVALGYVSSRTGAYIGRDTRKDLFSTIMSFSPAEINRFSQASLITRCTNDVSQVSITVVMFMRMVLLAPVMGTVAITQVLAQQSGLGFIIIAAVLFLLGIMVLMFALTIPRFKAMQGLIDRVNLRSREMLEGIMPIRAFSRETHELERFDEASTKLMNTQLFTSHVMALMRPGIQLILNISTVAIVWFGAQRVDVGVMQVGDVMAYSSYAMQIVLSFMTLAMVFVMMPRASVAADRIFEVLGCESSIKEPQTPVQLGAGSPHSELVFENVSFSYPDADGNALTNISFSVHAGETLGIVGSTGSGKSTIVQLIERLYDVTQGRVLVDGVDVRNFAIHDLRSRIGYVPQEGRLFSGTVTSNVLFGIGENEQNTTSNAHENTVHEALKMAQAQDFVDAMPQGVHSAISQGGSNVSGGQRQRLSIARALAKHPEFLVLDDSFSALDYATDAALRKELKEKLTDCAVVVVAQRVASVMHADKIIVLEAGHIVGEGTHQELLYSCPEYREIATSQLSPDELGITQAKQATLIQFEPPQQGGDS